MSPGAAAAAVPWACPRCHHPAPGAPWTCPGCGHAWGLREGLPWWVDGAQVRPRDRLLGGLYSAAPGLHDHALRLLLPILGGMDEESSRAAIFRRLHLEEGAPGGWLLDVGCGSGGNLVRLAPRHPGWRMVGVDLAPGMLRRARRRLGAAGLGGLPLGGADVHALPFPDAAFDRVLHVGAVNSFGDLPRALAELVRVTRDGGRVVLVDEQAAPDAAGRGRAWWALFRAVTFYAEAPRSPVAALPPEAVEVADEQLDGAFFVLSFEVRRR